MKSFFRRLSAHGDLWQRYLHWGSRHCPWFLEPMFIFAFSVMFWVFLAGPRRAVVANLGVLIPGSTRLGNHFRAIRVFWNFAWTMVDQAHVRHGQDCITWEIMGDDHLRAMEAQQEGAILLTAHMGNYDVAAPLLAERIRRPIHLVRAPERQRENQEFQAEQRAREQRGSFVIHYNEPGNMLGVELARAIQEGGVVAIQGDRVLFDVSPMQIAFREGVNWQIPRGPFLLSLITKAKIQPVFIIRLGYRRYGVLATAPITVKVGETRDKEGAQLAAAQKWNAVLRRVMQRHWRQWFVFEPVFTTDEDTPLDSSLMLTSSPPAIPEIVDRVLPAKTGRNVSQVYPASAAVGAWTAMVMLRWLMAASWPCAKCVTISLLIWPIVWFLSMVALTQTLLGLAVLLVKVTRLPMRSFDLVACGLTLVTFSSIGWREMQSGCPVGWWLGVLWFVGMGLGLVRAVIR